MLHKVNIRKSSLNSSLDCSYIGPLSLNVVTRPIKLKHKTRRDWQLSPLYTVNNTNITVH
jgi:hypothetical protein